MRWPRGPRRYDLAILVELARLRPRRYTLRLDGVPHELDAVLVAVGNCPTYGGGMRICPDADPTDGLLDVVVAGRVDRRTLIRVKPRIYQGTHVSHPLVRSYRARTVELSRRGHHHVRRRGTVAGPAGDDQRRAGRPAAAALTRTAPMLATMTSTMAAHSSRVSGLSQHQPAGERGDGRAEAHQHREGGGGHPAQRQQLQRVGQAGGEHREGRAERQHRRVEQHRAAVDDAQRQGDQRGEGQCQGQPVRAREPAADPRASTMYAAHMAPAPNAKATPTGSSRSKPPWPSSATPASASPAQHQLASRRAVNTDSASGPSTSRVTVGPSGMRSMAW